MAPYLWYMTLITAISGFLFGYDTGVISGAMIQLRKNFLLTYFYQEVIISITVFAAAIFAFMSGILNDHFGRKPVMIVSSAIFAIGSLILSLSSTKEWLMIGRFIVGAAIGLSSMTTPVYLVECSPTKYRSTLVTMNTLFITGGQFIASVTDGALFYDDKNGWRYMLGLAILPALIQFIGLFFVHESPRWLVVNGQLERAKMILKAIYKMPDKSDTSQLLNENINEEINSILESVTRMKEQDPIILDFGNNLSMEDIDRMKPKSSRLYKLSMFFKNPVTMKAMAVGCMLQLIQQLSGINTVMYYGASILLMAGLTAGSTNETKVIWLNVLVIFILFLHVQIAFMNFICSIIGVYLINKIKRRSFLIGSLSIVVCSLFLLCCGFQLIAFTSPQVTVMEQGFTDKDKCHFTTSCDSCVNYGADICGFCYQMINSTGAIVNGSCVKANEVYSLYGTYGRCSQTVKEQTKALWMMGSCPTPYGWLILLGLIIYLIGFAPGLGHLPWVINAELYPNWARSTGNSLAVATNWTANLIVSLTFLSMTQTLTKQGTFLLFTGFSLAGLIFTAIFVPETSNVSLERTDVIFTH